MNANVKNIKFLIFASSIIESDTMAGGYRIFIECLRQWLKINIKTELITSKQGEAMISRYLQNTNLIIRITGPNGPIHNPGFRFLPFTVLFYILRTINGIFQSFFFSGTNQDTIIYSTTPFWPDIFPAAILRLRNPKALWLVAFSMYAPPVLGSWKSGIKTGGKKFEWRALALKLNEVVVYPIIKRWADIIYVNNQLDLERIRADGFLPNRTLVVGGGINTELSNSVLDMTQCKIEYSAVFIGRFHPQKGVLELVDIWQRVCKNIPDAKLTMIGNGPLESNVADKIIKLGLGNNITMVGFKDGVEKIKIFHQNYIVVHPSLYDSGGMAAAEAMICGLPGVSYDLPALKTYYPKGMLKAKDQDEFIHHIIHLLNDKEFCRTLGEEAVEWARSWDWREVAQSLFTKILEVREQKLKNIDFPKSDDRKAT